MKKVILAVALFIFSFLFCFAQKEANVWYFGNFAGVDFNSGVPVALTNGQINTNEGCASIADKSTGQLLFYTEGTTVWDRNQNVMPNGTGLLGAWGSTQSAIIVPMPGSTTKFYIFTVDAEAGFVDPNYYLYPYSPYNYASTTGYGGLAYSIVDMTLNSGSGDIPAITKNIHLLTPTCEKLTAVRHCNGKDIWVIVHQWNTNAFYAYLVTAAGVSAPVISNQGIVPVDNGTGYNDGAIGYMKVSPDGKFLGMASDWSMQSLETFPFDNSAGIVGAPIFLDQNWNVSSLDGGPYGLTFSPNSKLLYVSVEGGEEVYQYNMMAGNGTAVLNSKTLVATIPDGYPTGALQIGPDGKIYLAEAGNNYLGVISNPNTAGAGCGFTEYGVYLSSGGALFGLPDMIESYLAAPYTASLNYTTCIGNSTLTFNDTILNGTITVLWNFGDPASGINNTSVQQNPVHTFSSSGSYTVSLYINNSCTTDTFVQTINTGGNISVVAGPDTSICSGNSVSLHSSGGTSWNWSPGMTLTDSTSANPSVIAALTTTTYTLTASSGACSSTATVTVNVKASPPTPTISISHDTLFCSFDVSYTSYQWYDSSTIINGATKAFFYPVVHSGNYNVSVSNENGCDIAAGITVLLNGIKNYLSENSISLSPNPAKDQFTVYGLRFTTKQITISLYNVLGENIFTQQLETQNSKPETVIDIRGLSEGIYFLKLEQDNDNWVGKFIKE